MAGNFFNKRQTVINTMVNIIVSVISCFFLVQFISSVMNSWHLSDLSSKWQSLLIMAAAVVLTQLLKAMRYYVIVFGLEISDYRILQLYFRTTIVSQLIPFKLGELYRMHAYGHELNSYSKGIILVILDRFFDSLGIITVGFIILLCNNTQLPPPIIIALTAFIFSICCAYLVEPSFYKFWNNYFIVNRTSSNTLYALRFLESINSLFASVRKIISGKFLILYITSLVSWIIEIAAYSLLTSGQNDINQYLLNISAGHPDSYTVLYSVFVLIFLSLASAALLIRHCQHRKEN